MYEHRGQPPISAAAFRLRMLRHAAMAGLVMTGSLALGTLGYIGLDRLGTLDALLHAALPLSGMGLVDYPSTPASRLFVSVYALYAGLVYVVASGIVIAPLLHRLLHRFHWTGDDPD